jgi:molecular chaperone DnaK
MIKGF